QAHAPPPRELDELVRLRIRQRQRLLAVDVLARLERGTGDLGVRERNREVDDGVDALVAEELVEARVRAAAVACGEGLRACRVEVGRAGELERLALRKDRVGVALGD